MKSSKNSAVTELVNMSQSNSSEKPSMCLIIAS
nr:MAG TPA: hypothetical protein [Caudoviricetes sp.]DAT22055.1 MAG TPA: hypothetical protein [Caudoviricetes sp.]DAZ61955.1 MAG TPA: hypothetical protein [Caudoviricetes sp.]